MHYTAEKKTAKKNQVNKKKKELKSIALHCKSHSTHLSLLVVYSLTSGKQ